MKNLGTVQIETSRLILRRFTLDDAKQMYDNYASDEKVTKYMTWQPHADIGVTKSLLREWVDAYEKDDYYNWAIVLKDKEELIGSIGATQVFGKIDAVSVGYCLASKYWHKGYTSEALAAIIEFLFDKVRVNRIEATHDVNNPNSGGVMRKCGMTKEGVLRKRGYNNTGICDVCIHSILASEYVER